MQGGDKKVVIKKFILVGLLLALNIVASVAALNGIRTPIDIDKTSPILVDFDYSINHRKVTFNFIVEEDNFKEIYYRDVANCNRKFIKYNTLCKRLSSKGTCFAVRDLCAGEHSMHITIVDKAKNTFRTEVFEFNIEP